MVFNQSVTDMRDQHHTMSVCLECPLVLTEPFTSLYNKGLYGKTAFSVTATRLWNSIPIFIREAPTLSTFRSKLESFLFRKAYLNVQSPCTMFNLVSYKIVLILVLQFLGLLYKTCTYAGAGLQYSRVCQITQGGKIEGAAFPEYS